MKCFFFLFFSKEIKDSFKEYYLRKERKVLKLVRNNRKKRTRRIEKGQERMLTTRNIRFWSSPLGDDSFTHINNVEGEGPINLGEPERYYLQVGISDRDRIHL